MFNLKKNQKTVFNKLYRYYCAKLLSKTWIVLFYFLFFILILIIQGVSFKKLFYEKLQENPSWQYKLFIFWIASFIQLFVLISSMTPLVSYLVGRDLGWSKLKRKQLFGMPKISREEDIKVLIFTPRVDRETVIWAKFAAIFTYFMAFNLFLVLIIFAYFLIFTELGVIAALLFLLLNGVGLALVNFLLMVPFLFYQQEGGSFLVYFISFIFTIILVLAGIFLGNFIIQYPAFFLLAYVPLSILSGYLFFSLYRKKFLKNDLD